MSTLKKYEEGQEVYLIHFGSLYRGRVSKDEFGNDVVADYCSNHKFFLNDTDNVVFADKEELMEWFDKESLGFN